MQTYSFIINLILLCAISVNSKVGDFKSTCTCEEESVNGNYCKKTVYDVQKEYDCFMADSSVTIINDNEEQLIKMKDLKIGDCVVDSVTEKHCSEVTIISHREKP